MSTDEQTEEAAMSSDLAPDEFDRAVEAAALHDLRHAASHALIAHLLGWPAGTGGDSCVHEFDHAGLTEAEFGWQSLCHSLAGPLSEADAEPTAYTVRRAVGDDNRVRASASWIVTCGQHPAEYDGQLTTRDLVKAATARTAELLTQHTAVVDALAEALLDHGSLDADQVAAIVEPISKASA